MKIKSVVAVIPARFASTRLPGKPLLNLAGRPMVEWVYRRASRVFQRVIVATDDSRIEKAVRAFGGEVMKTSRQCPSGTDRVAEVARTVKAPYYINVQGDEPLIDLRTLRAVAESARKSKKMTTAAVAIPAREATNPNVVKTIWDSTGKAIYFSRAMIPFYRKVGKGKTYFKHLGLYVYPRSVLFSLVRNKPPEIEKTEKLEQLRALFYGVPIQVVRVQRDSIGVDTPQDLRRLRAILLKTKQGI